MSTAAQIAANQANSQLSSGPTSAEGKAASARNNTRHGLAPTVTATNDFVVMPNESQCEFEARLDELRSEHQPATASEHLLVNGMAQHAWLRRRAQTLQHERCFGSRGSEIDDQKSFALYLRYEITHERGFHKCLNDLLKLRAEKRKQEIGFESQQRKNAEEQRQQEKHKMKKDRHQFDVLLTEARVDGQLMANMNSREPGMPHYDTADRLVTKMIHKLEAVQAA
jgi:hypothetical protein